MPTAPHPSRRRRRPAGVTWLAAGGLTFAAYYLARLVLGLSLPPLPLSVPGWYLPLTGAVWGGLGLALATGLWRGSRLAYRLTAWAVTAYLVWYWSDRVLFMRSDFAQRGLPAAALVSGLALAVILAVLSRPAVRAYFRETPDE